MNRDVNSIIKEIDWNDFLFKLNFYNIKIDLDVKTWDDVILKIFPKLIFFDLRFLENKQIISLNGSPKEFDEDFNCRYNELTSLKGAPQKVGGDFNCEHNKLTSLNGAPERVGNHFDCTDNQLTSLEGAPMEVGGKVFCIKGNYELPRYKVDAYKAYLKLPKSKKTPLIKDNHYYPTEEWENKFK
jgi:hypothetical protein